ncbi:retrovirus-related pol polyprotein from transposon TNT 1-94 [Tanacetum coccineum]
MSNPSIESFDASPVKMEASKELPKVSLVNESLKKLKFHVAKFDNVVKIRTTPHAHIEGEWGFEHTKAIFNNKIIPFLKSLKDIFNVFDKDLLNEIIEVQIVLYQMKLAVQQSLVDKQCLEIAKKVLLLENDRLSQQIMSQDVLLTVMNSMFFNGKSVNMERKRNESCDKCFNLDAELLKTQNAHIDLLKSYSQLEKHCMFKLDLEPLDPRLLQNREAHIDYLKYTQEQADILRITSANIVPPKKTTSHSVGTQKPELKVYSRKPKNVKNVDIPSSSSLVMIGTVRFGNNQIARIMGYGDYQLGNVTISKAYYVEGLGHNLFYVGQYCNMDLEVAFQKNTFFIRNLEGVDLLLGSRDINLYTISLDDMLKTSLISKDGLARGIPRIKFQKDHLCSTCALGKSKKSSHQPKAKETNQEKLYLLHMDLYGPMRVVSINGKRTKDEAPEAIIKCIKNIQVRLNATARNVRTYNGTKFVNQTLREFYENVGISHQTSVARTPQ